MQYRCLNYLFLSTFILTMIFVAPSASSTIIPYNYPLTKEQQALFLNSHVTEHPEIAVLLAQILPPKKPFEALLSCNAFEPLKSDRVHIVGQFTHYDAIVKSVRRRNGRATISRLYDDIDSNILRIADAKRLHLCIQYNNLTHIFVPQKTLVHIPGRPSNYHDDNYLVVADVMPVQTYDETCRLIQKLNIPDDQEIIEQLFKLITLTGFEDTHPGNIRALITPDTSLICFAIVDTEPVAIKFKKDLLQQGCSYELYKKSAIKGLNKFIRFLGPQERIFWRSLIKAWKAEHDIPLDEDDTSD